MTYSERGARGAIIPASPGYYALRELDGGEVWFVPVVAWRIDKAGRARPACVEWAPEVPEYHGVTYGGDDPGDLVFHPKEAWASAPGYYLSVEAVLNDCAPGPFDAD